MNGQARNQTELQAQRNKLTNSYKQLLDEFSSNDLRHVGNYTLGRLIGKGSFGKVYLAAHKLTNGSKVVLKSAKKDDPNLAREIHHHRQFLHPHIARLYEVIVTESLVWMVLEYCPGDELYTHVLNHGPMEPAKVQKIFTQLIGAVSYIHNKSCVHRDLKLENVLLDKYENVKLVDFGFTREYEGKSNYLQTWCGTVCYSAPEMLKGEKYAGEKVDVWSLGIILYALLAGQLPYDEDDEDATKMRILKEEPTYPETMPQGAKDLITQLLSKRPLLRPSLADILQHPWLAEHAPQQQAILKLKQPAPFTTDLEKETIGRMKSAGVDIDMVIENVLAQRCDPLAGWWALLIEKEEKKAKRRERKRREREAEAKSLRRLSAASSRLDRLGPAIRETDEEGNVLPRIDAHSRGRSAKRASGNYTVASIPDLPRLPEKTTPVTDKPLPPITGPNTAQSASRRLSTSRSRPPIANRDNRRSRASLLSNVQTNPDLLGPNGYNSKRRRKGRHPFLNQFVVFRNWVDNKIKRSKSPNFKGSSTASPKVDDKTATADANGRLKSNVGATAAGSSQGASRIDQQRRTSYPSRPRITTANSTSSVNRARQSLSPSPLTPRSSFRGRNSGLRGRKSTSSSVSSVRSLVHHQHNHSKASSTSSASASLASPSITKHPSATRSSPHTSVKVLPATPTSSKFPSNIRVVRTNAPTEAASAFGGLPPPSPGLNLHFAKRRKSPFKGPMLSLHTTNSPTSRSQHRDASANSGGASRSGSVQGRKSTEQMILEEEDEEEAEDDAGSLPSHDVRRSTSIGRTSIERTPSGRRRHNTFSHGPTARIGSSHSHSHSIGHSYHHSQSSRHSRGSMQLVEMEEDEPKAGEEEIEEVDRFSPVDPGSTAEMIADDGLLGVVEETVSAKPGEALRAGEKDAVPAVPMPEDVVKEDKGKGKGKEVVP